MCIRDSLKEDLRDVINELAIVTSNEQEIVLAQALDARNRFANRSGFSAHQRVYGRSLRLPGSLMSDDPLDRMAMATDESTEFQRAAEIRDAATQALFKSRNQSAIKKAAKTRPRRQPRDQPPISAGSVVYVWRNSVRKDRKYKGWVGPGLVVCVNAKDTSAYVSMRGVLVKTNMDRIRTATDPEYHGAELIRILSPVSYTHLTLPTTPYV